MKNTPTGKTAFENELYFWAQSGEKSGVIDNKGNVISGDVYKSVIKVTERMSYTDVYKIIEYIESFNQSEE